jgi:A/G-specific adenine glycosylase
MSEKIMNLIEIKNFTTDLISWQKKHGRHDLPWQSNRTAYRVWISEIMLQQTQVATVIDRYQKFLLRFPTVKHLAKASVDEVLAEWSGMGYYSRARNLHRCAQEVVRTYKGVFPSDPKKLEELPGIGRSTAAAIAVFAYGKSAAILDGNVKRVLARVWGIKDDLSKSANVKELWGHAEYLLPKSAKDLVIYTQGIMDFGATFCTPKKPTCLDSGRQEACPFLDMCQAFKEGQVLALPKKIKKVKVLSHQIDWYVLIQSNQILLEKRGDKGIWAGLWAFPEIAQNDWMVERTLEPIQHTLTHRRLSINPHLIKAKKAVHLEKTKWFKTQELDSLGLPKPVKTVLKQLNLIRDDV